MDSGGDFCEKMRKDLGKARVFKGFDGVKLWKTLWKMWITIRNMPSETSVFFTENSEKTEETLAEKRKKNTCNQREFPLKYQH